MRPRWFVRGDVDGFFGLFVDNLLQLMLIQVWCTKVVPLPSELVTGRILPGAAISILLGNVFYAWQARRLSRRTGQEAVTALPYGINTPSLIAYVFLIMLPVYQETQNATLAWQAGLFACLLSGIMELAGAFVGDWLRRVTPRAALLSALAGVAITFIAVGFVFQIFSSPAIALLPMMMILVSYSSRMRLPLGLSGGLVAIGMGTLLAWGLRLAGYDVFIPATDELQLGWRWPTPVPGDTLELLASGTGWRYLAVIFPMGLFNVIGSLQNLESAEAAGDRYETKPSLWVNGLGTVAAAFLGSPFPTTIYIGHPGWKAMGARHGYSLVNGLVIAGLCLVGGVTMVLRVVPLEVALGILLWIGIVITAQAFEAVPKTHAVAVAAGLIPSLAAWALVLIQTTLRVAGRSLAEVAPALTRENLFIEGVIALNQGFLITAMILSALLVHVIERRFFYAAAWAGSAALLAAFGVIHAYTLTEAGVQNVFRFPAAPWFALMYAGTAAILTGVGYWYDRMGQHDAEGQSPGLETRTR